MPKVVINKCYGGFSLSEEGLDKYNELSGKELEHSYSIERDDIFLLHTVELLGEKANGRHAKLKIVDIPDDVAWFIDDYDGIEDVHEDHRTWS